MGRVFEAAFDEPYGEPAVRSLLAAPAAWSLVAEPEEDGGGPGLAGFVIATTAADEAEVLTLAVAPRWRRRGVARALVESALAEAAARGGAVMFLEVGEDNRAARALYARLGFEAVARRAGYYRRADRRPVDAVVMRRRIDPARAAFGPFDGGAG